MNYDKAEEQCNCVKYFFARHSQLHTIPLSDNVKKCLSAVEEACFVDGGKINRR